MAWRIVSPGAPAGEGIPLVLGPGPGFGSGDHPTTRLCLQAIAALRPRRPFRMLDLGTGSGILAIAAARLSAEVEAVDIDQAALAHAARNLELNGVASSVRLHRSLEEVHGVFDLAVANILGPVLLDLAAPLAARVAPGGTLVISGLVAGEVPELAVRYAAALGKPEVFRLEEWRALVFRAGWRG
jgi:ribosomal protein L11 methyltransferase